jgi:hypothetical protein
MLDILEERLKASDALSAPSHVFVNALMDAIPFSTVPDKMKTVFALSHMSSFASQFRRNIELWDGTEVPVNNISFVVADSGANKDSSNSKIKKCFQSGYETINKFAKEAAKEAAIEAAKRAGEQLPTEFSTYVTYLKPVPPVFMSITTGPGFVQHVNDMAELPISSCSIYSGELSDELASNPHALETIKILSELYDLGEKEATYTKGAEFRAKAIKGQPVSALLVGSPGHILYDEATKKKFQVAFMSKLARRSWFCYAPERIREPDFSDCADPIRAMQDHAQEMETKSKAAIALIHGEVDLITEYQLSRLETTIKTEPEVFDLFTVYKRYNHEIIQRDHKQDTLYALVRGHLQWKALKLAGSLAIIEQSETVTAEHYAAAIQYCEIFDNDITDFEVDINKAAHERLADFLRTKPLESGTAFINNHDIKKMGFSSTVSKPKLHELATLCSGYDVNGVYTVAENDIGIIFEPYVLTDVIGVSYKKIDNSVLYRAQESGDEAAMKAAKIAIAKTANSGYTYGETTFSELADMLKGDFAYSSFQFKDGLRDKNGIIGGTKWIVFDIDKTHVSIDDAHAIMRGVNHHIALTSDASNRYKYRVLVELDSFVTLPAVAWKHFYTKVAEDLGLQVDVLPQSQIFFAYSDREVFSELEGTPIACREYLLYAKEREAKSLAPVVKQSSSQKQQQLDSPFDTFWYAFECVKGRRSVTFFRAIRHAIELGATLDYVHELLDQINDYLTEPLDDFNFNRLKVQATHMFEVK